MTLLVEESERERRWTRVVVGFQRALRNHSGPRLERKNEELRLKKSEELSRRRMATSRWSDELSAFAAGEARRSEAADRARRVERRSVEIIAGCKKPEREYDQFRGEVSTEFPQLSEKSYSHVRTGPDGPVNPKSQRVKSQEKLKN
jgi:hypothetical protein